jgi:hypothetical protein
MIVPHEARAKYYHVDLWVFRDGDLWTVELFDPLKSRTVNEKSRDATLMLGRRRH